MTYGEGTENIRPYQRMNEIGTSRGGAGGRGQNRPNGFSNSESGFSDRGRMGGPLFQGRGRGVGNSEMSGGMPNDHFKRGGPNRGGMRGGRQGGANMARNGGQLRRYNDPDGCSSLKDSVSRGRGGKFIQHSRPDREEENFYRNEAPLERDAAFECPQPMDRDLPKIAVDLNLEKIEEATFQKVEQRGI